jgi:serine/threonine-protein kinase
MVEGPPPPAQVDATPRVVGRYALYQPIAAGGMAVVHLGRLLGPVGFSRTVAVKRVHPNFAHDRDFVVMFVDEARLAARIHHPNVVSTLDVVMDGGEILLVMEYVHGESLARLVKSAASQGAHLSLSVCSAIMTGVLHGLHAAHEARSEQGEPLNLVHRDVSPQNILVGADGVARILDFGVATAVGRLQTTREGKLKGKLGYMAPEQLDGKEVSRQTDLYSAAVVTWEMLTGRRLFREETEGATLRRVLMGETESPSTYAPEVSAALDALVLRGLDRDPTKRFASAHEMALALEELAPPAVSSEVAKVVQQLGGDALRERAEAIATVESLPQNVGTVSGVLDILPRANEGTTQSQLSIITDSLKAPSPSSRAWRTRAAILLGSLLAAGGGVLLLGGRAHRRSAQATGSSMPPPISYPSASGDPAPSPSAAASAPSAASAIAASSSVTSTRPAPGRTAPPPAGKGTAKGCDPPFVVDAAGRHIYKRDCF